MMDQWVRRPVHRRSSVHLAGARGSGWTDGTLRRWRTFFLPVYLSIYQWFTWGHFDWGLLKDSQCVTVNGRLGTFSRVTCLIPFPSSLLNSSFDLGLVSGVVCQGSGTSLEASFCGTFLSQLGGSNSGRYLTGRVPLRPSPSRLLHLSLATFPSQIL